MKGLIRGTFCIVVVLLISRPCISSFQRLRSFSLVTAHVIECDVRLSVQSKNEITRYIMQEKIFKTIDGKKQFQLVKERFPFIKDYTCTVCPSGVGRIGIYAHDLLGVIDDSLMVLSNGVILDKNCFDSSYLKLVPQLCFGEGVDPVGNRCDDSCVNFMRNFDWSITRNYRCVWHGPTQIALINKELLAMTIIFSGESLPSSALIASCERILQKNSEQKRGMLSDSLIMDTRFRGQIVVHSCKKGGHDGKNIC